VTTIMDIALLANLKEQLVNSKKYIKVWEYFLDHFGEDPAFIALGERVHHPLIEAVFAQVARQLFKHEVDWDHVFFTGLPEHDFIHGGGLVSGGLLNVLYFDDIQTGLLCAVSPSKTGETKFVRFSGHKLRGEVKPSLN
jgi:hypothetical protein